jgi:4-hydroxy-tetrahydrodipicolinate reductase
MSAETMLRPRIAIIGDGKMGRAVAAVARDAGCTVTTVIGEGTPVSRESLGDAQVAIEFTQPSAAVSNAKACIDAHCPIVIGTTGWYDQLPALADYASAQNGTVLWAMLQACSRAFPALICTSSRHTIPQSSMHPLELH